MSLEVLFNCERHNIKRPEDALLCAIHCCLTSSGYKCVANGEEVPAENAKKSDMLPNAWNDVSDSYALVYQSTDTADTSSLILKVVNFDGLMLVHLLKTSDETAIAIEIKTADFTTNNFSSFESAYLKLEELDKRLKSELLAPVQRKTVKNSETKKSPVSHPDNSADPLRVSPRRPPVPEYPLAEWEPHRNPFAVGRGDLDPFQSGSGGGMFFDPMRPAGGLNSRYGGGYTGIGGPSLPRGAIVPGSRYDPFGPPDLDRSGNVRHPGAGNYRSGPDPDHLLPPGYDDMFM